VEKKTCNAKGCKKLVNFYDSYCVKHYDWYTSKIKESKRDLEKAPCQVYDVGEEVDDGGSYVTARVVAWNGSYGMVKDSFGNTRRISAHNISFDDLPTIDKGTNLCIYDSGNISLFQGGENE
jgi:hypothetical protein